MASRRDETRGVSRRTFIAGAAGAAMGSLIDGSSLTDPSIARGEASAAAHQAMGTRAGEATPTTARVWARVTQRPERNSGGDEPTGRANPNKAQHYADEAVDAMHGACPGMAGRVRLRYGLRDDLSDAISTDWFDVDAAGDFIHQFDLTDLKPGSVYFYESQTAEPDGKVLHAAQRGRFETAMAVATPTDMTACIMTCQMYHDRDHADGHPIYPSMAALEPKFTCLTGDLVYYDNEAPSAMTERLARYHWERMFSLPRLRSFTSNFGTYWLKDDHDTLRDDSWPGERLGDLTFAEGQAIFRQQAPMSGGPSYRTIRWGRDLQIWLAEGRDDRSPNTMPDGPAKTIWGAEQKAWFRKTIAESDATWKILVSPTPLVGPDRKGKHDNLANDNFKYEGDEIRGWIQQHAPDHFFVICGDRHWQYHSVHPKTGLVEFSVGAASDSHAGGSPGYDPKIHKFHRVGGGFLSLTLKPEAGASTIALRLHDVNGKVVHELTQRRTL